MTPGWFGEGEGGGLRSRLGGAGGREKREVRENGE